MRNLIKSRFTAVILTAVMTLNLAWIAMPANACSRILWNTNGDLVISVRSMDWDHSFEDLLFIYPRGVKKDGGAGEKSAQWTSKYGSLVASIYTFASKYGFGLYDGATEGINEKGLAAHILYLEETDYEKEDDRAGVTYMRWLEYLLDNFATVDEAVAGMKDVRIVPVKLGDEVIGVHLAIEDASGDSAIFEVINGKMVVHHGKQYTVMTNDPPYDVQIKNLKRYKAFGGKEELPGDIEGAERFVRGAYFSQFLPETEDPGEAVASALSVIRNLAVPFGAPYGGRAGEGVYPTWWMSATDFKNRIFYFNWAQNPNIVWVDLDDIDFSEGTSVRMADPKNPALVGNIAGSFTPVKKENM